MSTEKQTVVAQNYSLLKQQTGNAKLSHNRHQLKAMVKQREITIAELARNVEGYRTEMKKLSKQVNLKLEKQNKKQHKEGPSSWVNHLTNNRLKQLQSQLDAAYSRNEEVKGKIDQIREDQPQEIVKQTQANQSKLAMLEKQTAKIERNKQLLMQELQKNKQRIEQLRENSCLIDLEQRQAEYEQVKRQCKIVEKEFTITSAQFLQVNNYYYEMKSVIEKQVIQEKIQPYINPKQIEQLIADVNFLADQRRILEKDTDLKRKNCYQSMHQLQKQIRQRHIMIRQIQNDILRVGLQSRRVTSYATEPRKTVNYPKKEVKRVSNPQIKPEKKQKIVNKVYMMQRQQQKTIIVGDWNTDGKIFSDRGQNWQITVQKTKKMTFLFQNQELTGVRSLYQDRHKNSIQGRTLLAEGTVAYSEVEISLQNVTAIEYSGRNSPIYLRFISYDGTTQEIGKKETADNIERVSLEHYVIKWVQVQFDDKLVGIRVSLEDKPIEDKIIAEQTPQKGVTQRSFSNSTLGPKRVILKGRSLTKLKQGPIVDHRLMLSKNKMV